MVENQIKFRGVRDEAVIRAMLKVPRHKFVPPASQREAYGDYPLPIGHGQTISQPYIVAAMTELLQLTPEDRVLEIGTGSGYHAAVIAEIAAEVFTIEIVEPLGISAAERLRELGYDNVHVKVGDGYLGWPEHAPFDAIIVTCAPENVPAPLVEQLKPGGRMCIPVGPMGEQELYLLTRRPDGTLETRSVFPVRFVPLVRDTP
jgi:protein-L-isoaspartate(D-aspartate) O-methyltransferase